MENLYYWSDAISSYLQDCCDRHTSLSYRCSIVRLGRCHKGANVFPKVVHECRLNLKVRLRLTKQVDKLVRTQSSVHAQREVTRVLSANVGGETLQSASVELPQRLNQSEELSYGRHEKEEPVRVDVVAAR